MDPSDRGLDRGSSRKPHNVAWGNSAVLETFGHEPDPTPAVAERPVRTERPRKQRVSKDQSNTTSATQGAAYENALPALGTFTPAEQEKLVMDDLLYVLMGIDGNYINRDASWYDNRPSDRSDGTRFEVDPTMGKLHLVDQRITTHVSLPKAPIDISIAELVKRILPLPYYLHVIDKYIDLHAKFKYGRVQHALAATMQDLRKNFLLLIVQLESQAMSAPQFGLQKLWFYLHPSLNTMAALASLIDAITAAEQLAGLTEPGREQTEPKAEAVKKKPPTFTRGGGLALSVLCERLLSFRGDPVLKALYAQLLSSSAVPYNATLATWIHSGEIFDPFDEFMVVETRGLNRDEFVGAYNDVYWEHRYTLRHDYVPPFLSVLQDKTLLAGKYLNVVRECGVAIPEPHVRYDHYRAENGHAVATARPGVMSDVVVAMGGERFVEDIETAYGYANHTLLGLLFKDHHLMERLRSVKHYFLLDQSDFLVHFLDVAHEHLLKPAQDVGVEQVKSLLELVLRDPAASPGTNKYKDDIEAELSSSPLVPRLMKELQKNGGRASMSGSGDRFDLADSAIDEPEFNGIEAFQLKYTAPFPVSLIINKKVLLKYQLTFRHLFQCKYIERQLSDAWREQSKSGLYTRSKRFRVPRRRTSAFLENGYEDRHDDVTNDRKDEEEEESMLMSRMCALRTKMLHFMQQYMYHVGYEVVEQLWQKFEEEVVKADTIEDVIQIHLEFQDRCMKECMLSNAEMVKAFRKLMLICTDFCRFSLSYTRYRSPYSAETEDGVGVPAGLGHSSHPSALPERLCNEYIAASGGTILSSDEARRKLESLEQQFSRHMRVLIEILKYYGATEAALFASLAARLDYNHFYARLPPDLSIVVRAPTADRGSAARQSELF
ncbi:Gamma-tubulin complex component 2 [Geranomyces variabilis]|nr:Gamma-tubulin complex component 2 [Geranomyces variabilis]